MITTIKDFILIKENKHKGEIVSLNKIHKLYHQSNPFFRDIILKTGLKCMKGDSYSIHSPEEDCIPAIFAYRDDMYGYDSSYDDDIYEILFNKIPNTWYVDNEAGNMCLVTYKDIPVSAIKLIYKGTGNNL